MNDAPQARSRVLLVRSAAARFPHDDKARAEYIRQHLDASESYDATAYRIRPSSFAILQKNIVAAHGPRPALTVARLLPPGTWLAMLIQVATFGYVRPCAGCKSRARKMDAAGWRWLPRLLFDPAAQWLRAAWREVRSRKKA